MVPFGGMGPFFIFWVSVQVPPQGAFEQAACVSRARLLRLLRYVSRQSPPPRPRPCTELDELCVAAVRSDARSHQGSISRDPLLHSLSRRRAPLPLSTKGIPGQICGRDVLLGSTSPKCCRYWRLIWPRRCMRKPGRGALTPI